MFMDCIDIIFYFSPPNLNKHQKEYQACIQARESAEAASKKIHIK